MFRVFWERAKVGSSWTWLVRKHTHTQLTHKKHEFITNTRPNEYDEEEENGQETWLLSLYAPQTN